MFQSFSAFCQHQRRFRRLTDYIGTCLDEEDLRIRDLADIACLSPAHLLRLYRTRTGESPMQTVRRLRLQHACERIKKEPGVSITEIAFAAGYDSNAAFSHAFRRLFGIAPREIRNLPVRPPAPVALHLEILPERKVWQFRFTGNYHDNGHYKARLAWLCLEAGSRKWRGWRLNDKDHPFTEDGGQRVDLCHFVPVSQHPHTLPEADMVTHKGGHYVVAEINPLDRERCMATLGQRVRHELHCTLTEEPPLEHDLQVRDYKVPQERRIALYVPVIPLVRI